MRTIGESSITTQGDKMATVFYIRKGAKQGNVTSSREVAVADLINLYGSAPSSYSYLKGADSPDIGNKMEPAPPGSDAAHVIVRIESDEVNKDTFPEAGFYRVQNVKP